MKQTYRWLAIGIFFLTGRTEAALSDDFVTQSAAAIADACGSSINYDVNRPFDKKEQDLYGGGDPVKDEYIETMNCMVNNAMAGVIKESNQKAVKATQKYSQTGKFKLTKKEPASKCNKKTPSPNFKTKCPEGDSKFSNCRVTEQMNAEWCGYNMYLWSKMRHDRRLNLQKKGSLKTNVLGQVDFNTQLDTLSSQQARLKELQAAKEAAEIANEQAEVLYQSQSEPYEESAGEVAVAQHLKEFNKKLLLFRVATSTWKAKFVNAQAKFCKQ